MLQKRVESPAVARSNDNFRAVERPYLSLLVDMDIKNMWNYHSDLLGWKLSSPLVKDYFWSSRRENWGAKTVKSIKKSNKFTGKDGRQPNHENLYRCKQRTRANCPRMWDWLHACHSSKHWHQIAWKSSLWKISFLIFSTERSLTMSLRPVSLWWSYFTCQKIDGMKPSQNPSTKLIDNVSIYQIVWAPINRQH